MVKNEKDLVMAGPVGVEGTCLVLGEALWENILGRVYNPTKNPTENLYNPTERGPLSINIQDLMRGGQLKFDPGAFPCMRDVLYPIYR